MIDLNNKSTLEIESFMKQNSFKLKLSLSQPPNNLIKNEKELIIIRDKIRNFNKFY